MKYTFLLLFALSSFGAKAIGTDIFSVESNYTTQFGYRYFFDRIDPFTGTYMQVAQLPVKGFYTNIKFINCFGNYVFLGVDSASPQNTYYYRLYEIDTATGAVVRSIPTDTGLVPKMEACHPSSTSPGYYAIRNLPTGEYRLVYIDAVTGVSSTISTTPVLNQVIGGDNSVITFSDQIWFGSSDWNNGYYFLYHVNTNTGQFTKKDSLPISAGNNYINLFYNCMRDTVYGFIANAGNLGGAELIKIGGTGPLIHTGTYLAASGTFYTSQYTMLHDGRLFFRGTSATSYVLDTVSVNATPVPFAGPADAKLFAAPRMACYSACNETSGINDNVASQSFSMYPNPVTNGFFTVKMQGEMQVEIIDLAGRVVLTAKGRDEISLNVANLPAAVYGVKITSGEKISFGKVAIAE
jgi:hypothetical protein